MSTTTHHRICPLCEACCGLEIKVEDQKGKRYEPGWKAIRDILAHRIDIASCIDEDAIDV